MGIAASTHAATPTDVRAWRSSAGTTIEAKATALDGTLVTLETPARRVLKVDLTKFADEDRLRLQTHFQGGEQATQAPAAELAQPLGQVVGPIDANGSHYFLYLPKSLKAGSKAPLLFFTHSGGGNSGRMKPILEGAEICGWIVAMSVESKNGMETKDSVVHCQHCMAHLLGTLPINPKRVYFSGTSGGAREAFSNSSQMESAGVLALIAGAAPDELSRSKHYFFVSGATDYNRYDTSFSYNAVKSNSAIRFHPGKHEDGPAALMTEGMVWLEAKARQKSRGQTSGDSFELAATAWAEGMSDQEPYRAAWWADFLGGCHFGSAAQMRLDALKRTTGGTPEAIAYAKGLADLEKFAADVLAKDRIYSPECMEHTTPEIQKKAEKLLETHSNTPKIKEILEGLRNKTCKG